VSRKALAAVSLVAAIPGGVMAYFAIMGLLTSAGDMPTLVLGITGAATAMGVLIALLPIVILVGKRKTQAAPAKAAKAEKVKEPAAVAGAQTAEVVLEDQEQVSEENEDTEAIASADEQDATDDFKFEDDAFMEDELMKAEPEPEPEPKKKKKKR
jgi:hypothetical protein